MAKASRYPVQEFAVRVSPEVGCLSKALEGISATQARISSLACACADGPGLAQFVVESAEPLQVEALKGTEVPATVIDVSVLNQAGCLERVVSSLESVGVSIGSLACACSAGDAAGTVSVGLKRG